MNKKFYNIYQYTAFFVIFPLVLFIWYQELKSLRYVLYIVSLPTITGYIIPALGTNVTKLWAFNTKFKAGNFRIYHGFVLGSATSLFGYMFYKVSPVFVDITQALFFSLLSGAFIAFWNWIYDIYAVKCGFIKVYNKPFFENKSAQEIVFDYAPVYFYVFGFIYAIYIKILEYYYPAPIPLYLFILMNILALTLPAFVFSLISYKNNKTFGIAKYTPTKPFDCVQKDIKNNCIKEE